VHVVGRYWLVYDVLPPTATVEDAWLSLHFAPDAAVREQAACFGVVAVGGTQLAITTNQDTRWMTGSRRPTAGWVSPRYGELEPAAECQVATASESLVVTLLEPLSGASGAPALHVESASGAIGVRITRDDAAEYLLVSRDAPMRRLSLFGIDFEGVALWLRVEGTRPKELRAVNGLKATSEVLGFSLASRRGPTELSLVFDSEATSAAARQDADLSLARP
jgi:hypothetical protein